VSALWQQPFFRIGGFGSQQVLRLFDFSHRFAGRFASSHVEVPSNCEARRRISCFIYVCGLSAALDQEAVQQDEGTVGSWKTGPQWKEVVSDAP
jgi:hypothetical protein